MGIHKSHTIDEQLDMITVEIDVDLSDILATDTDRNDTQES